MSVTPRHDRDDRLMELLADQATGSLSEADRAELDALLGRTAERDIDAAIAGMLTAFEDPAPRAMPAELKARLAKTIAFLKGLKREQFEGAGARDISLKAGPNELKFKGDAYLTTFVLPNFHFHATIAYAILRHAGVDIGKRDFLGKIQ